MTHEQIKAALVERGYSLSAAAQAMSRSYIQLYNTTTRKTRSRYVANAIAVLLDQPVASVFPDVPEYTNQRAKTDHKIVESGRAKLIEAGLMSA